MSLVAHSSIFPSLSLSPSHFLSRSHLGFAHDQSLTCLLPYSSSLFFQPFLLLLLFLSSPSSLKWHISTWYEIKVRVVHDSAILAIIVSPSLHPPIFIMITADEPTFDNFEADLQPMASTRNFRTRYLIVDC